MNPVIIILSLLLMNPSKPTEQQLNLNTRQKIEYIANAAEIDPDLIHAMMIVESEGNPHVVGDGNRKHKAYGLFQIRQPALSEMNRIYNLNHSMDEVRKSEELQIAYCVLHVAWLKQKLKATDAAIVAYNVGLAGYLNGRRGKYLIKVKKAKERIRNGIVQ